MMRDEKAFTLVEVMVAVGILAALSALTAQTIRNSLRDKVRIQSNIDRTSTLRNALKVIEKDIHMAFHYQDLNAEVRRLVKERRQKKQPPNPDDPDAPPPPPAGGDPNDLAAARPNPTAFFGQERELHFTNLNNTRIYANKPESDQQEVGYFLESCRKIGRPDESSDCLWRRSTPILDDKVEEGGSARVLLEDVTKLSFRYYHAEDDEWISQWKSKDGGDARTKDRFPEAVEVTLEVNFQGKKQDKVVAVIPIRHPNNKEKDDPSTREGGIAPPPVQGGGGR